MSVETAGIRRTADLFSGPEELVRQNMGELAVVIVFVTVLAPLIRLVGMLYVLIRLHETTPPGHLRRIFAWAERLRPWSMLEVFVFGVFVAYVKLGDLVTIRLATGVYALLALTFVLIWMDSALAASAADGRPITPTLPQHAAGSQAEPRGAHLALGHRRGGSLHPGQFLTGSVGSAARRPSPQHEPRRCRASCCAARRRAAL